ncbi:NAD(P)-dependent oxidoreductase [Hymenobacter jeollabukensis]|uniref:NAD(P)-binding domain-containing protein n=1 Tax=Hymenobacter jeollabukensis TaxID=2025313 RepID=A0A5R8WIA1_9BACT|nr:NAD(P)H-binding protein [Hymenobacter jeollabukensis]TLM88579.1 hypothetical protein FDY95_23815 [Hymenobacter jeollabukensis]
MLPYSIFTVAVLGGAGRIGRPVVERALHLGYHVQALLRHPDQFSLTHERLAVVAGDARDPAALRQLLRGSQALISTLGTPREAPTPIIGAVTALLLPLLHEQRIGRYVTVTSLYDTGQAQPDPATRQAAAYMADQFPAFVADRRRERELLTSSSSLNWTCIRLPRVVDAPPTGHVGVSLTQLPGPQITAVDLADFLVGQLDSAAYSRQAPFVASGGA